jgi:hypothetical protein
MDPMQIQGVVVKVVAAEAQLLQPQRLAARVVQVALVAVVAVAVALA